MLGSDYLKLYIKKPIFAIMTCGVIVILLIFQFLGLISNIKNATQTHRYNKNLHIESNALNQEQLKRQLSNQIFGRYIPKQLGDASIQPSVLNLKVLGVMYSKNKKDSQVIIQLPHGIERTFKNGDIIPGGATILHISVDGVIVTRDGVLERLNLPKTKLIFDKPLKPLK
ncbi:MAG: type II secretion system protein N [Legionellaceae bacterium]|nr:type II secretion system protein N [Legionellaceae bacterium]